MRGPGTWWRGKSTPAKVETYTRVSFHFFAVLEIVVGALPALAAIGGALGALLAGLVCAHAAVCVLTVSRSVDWVRGRREQPVWLLVALCTLTAAVAVMAFAVAEYRPQDDEAGSTAGSVFGIVMVYGVGILTLGLRERRQVYAAVAGFGAGAAVVVLALSGSPLTALGVSAMVLCGSGFVAFIAVFSVWLLRAVYELDEARETRARLAVAEERLRFGRDLHDVLGRNLAVIALKSELAVRFARRGRPEAVEQMIEVQRIAQESQREVREVVRGYREADLDAELAGARGVLTAAGIDCEVSNAVTELPDAVQSALGWVVREATTNVLRHGNAQRCTVSVRQREGRVVLTVENDGVSDVTGSGGGSGLAGLRERLAAVAGTLEAGAERGVFRVVAEVPLTAVVV